MTATLPLHVETGAPFDTGDVQLAAKYKFLHQKPGMISADVAFFPRLFVLSGRGSRRMQILLPLWAGRDFGKWSLFGSLLLVLALLYWRGRVSHVALFWAVFILTRPLGATVGDFLDKPPGQGGLDLGRGAASVVLVTAIVLAIHFVPQRPGKAH